jgi:uncharacterized protein YodC (DUF2158 family)
MAEIKAGDIVQLKSGGPRMTVSKIYNDGDGVMRARCDWFEDNKPQYGSFPVLSLKHVE